MRSHLEFKNIKTDCLHFLGYIPCKPNKNFGVHCLENDGMICKYYIPTGNRILIIKLGAAGDVIRTTPLLYPLREKYVNAHITWITHFPELVPSKSEIEIGVDSIFNYDEKSISVIKNSDYDLVINLDKDLYACALVKERNNTKGIFGYTLANNKPFPFNNLAVHKFTTGLFDDISKTNTKSYLEELFEICGFVFNNEEYILPKFETQLKFDLDKTKKIIGLNTGCGGRWTSRLWPEEYWIELSRILIKNNYEVVLLGGPEEDEKNKRISKQIGVKYFGTFPLKSFIGLMNECNVIVSAVTMAMHIAIGLKKQLVLLNNIFNKKEFELYHRGVIIEPAKECKCYFRSNCINEEYKCINYISPENVFYSINQL